MIANTDAIANNSDSTEQWLTAHQLQMNNVDPAVLFDRYERGGFLYPKKRQLLDAFMPEITANWRKAIQAGDKILWYVTHETPDGAWATMSGWKSTHTGWVAQHLVSVSPRASKHVLLTCQDWEIRRSESNSYQNWFQPTNRSARALHGSIEEDLGASSASVRSYDYFSLPVDFLPSPEQYSITIQRGESDSQSLICSLAEQERGTVYVAAEELDHPDLELHAVDELYKSVGLRRYRRIFLARRSDTTAPCGVAIAYRGPLGLNFSYLENRIDLILAPMHESESSNAARCLLSTASQLYTDFSPGQMLVTTVDSHRNLMESVGAKRLRTYCQSIWLRRGFEAWKVHAATVYQRNMTHVRVVHGKWSAARSKIFICRTA